MKTKTTFLSLILLIGILSSCTPTPINTDTNVQIAPTIYGVGGEQSAEPDNDKD